MVDGTTVPEPKDKGWGRGELGREALKFCTVEGRQSQGVWGETPTALPPRGRVKSVISRGGGGREEGLALAALQHSMAQEESC